MANVTMDAKDTINAKQGEAYAIVDGNRYLLMQLKNINATFEKTKSEVKIAGRLSTGHKTTGWNGTGSATMYYGSPIFRQLAKKYKATGQDIYFDIQITNDDPESDAGRQTIILKGCNLDSIPLVLFGPGTDDAAEEDMDFTFEDFEMPEEFKLLLGVTI